MEGKQVPTSTKDGQIIHCKSENVVLVVVLGVIVDASPRSDADAASGDREQDIPDWLQPLTEGLVEGESGSSGTARKKNPKTLPPHIPARPRQKHDALDMS